jgi:polyisoprenyl-teichoic acid--peptidoglycan teichoic acid transferase
VSRSLPARRPDARSAAAAFLSFLVPGLGQGYNGQWLLATALAVPVLLLVGLGIGLAATGGSASLVTRLLDTRVLVALVVLDVALLGWRLVAILQAHAARGGLSLRSWPGAVTGLLVIATLAMHALPAFYAAKAIDTLGSVALEGGGALFDEREGRDVVIAVPSDQPEVRLGERLTVLLVGVDFAPGRENHLTDTMLVATLEPDTGEAAMVSIPRDLYGVPLGDGRVYNAKLNSLLATASADPATYPLGGPATLKAAIGELLGTRIHYFAAIDIEGMREVIDTIGGVDVTVERTIDDPRYRDTLTGEVGLYLPAGPQHLDGAAALGFARSRMSQGESDFTRAARQQVLLAAIAEKLTAGNVFVTLPGLLDAAKRNIATDIPSSRLSAIASAVEEADLAGIERTVLTPEDGFVTVEAYSAVGYILHPNLDAIRALGERIFATASANAPAP